MTLDVERFYHFIGTNGKQVIECIQAYDAPVTSFKRYNDPVKDRRQFARAEVKWPVTIICSEQKAPGEIASISHSGARIYSQELLPPGQELSLVIQPPNHQSFCVFAKTVWGIIADSPEKPYRFVLGVQFEDISEDDIQFISEIFSK